MPDDKTTKAPETAAPDTGPGKVPEQAPVKEPVKTEPSMPEQKPPEQDADKAAPPKDKESPTSEKAGAEKSPKTVSVTTESLPETVDKVRVTTDYAMATVDAQQASSFTMSDRGNQTIEVNFDTDYETVVTVSFPGMSANDTYESQSDPSQRHSAEYAGAVFAGRKHLLRPLQTPSYSNHERTEADKPIWRTDPRNTMPVSVPL